ncbi:MAG: nuclear transport factor 2 family protein [Nocardioides sp.]|nr:nuclear transport factor 2 family protein [Nocardioides sp.]
MARDETLEVALGFMSALDANDAEAVRACMAPGATWWVDTGLDRLSGVHGTDPGEDRPWPLHGEMDVQAKCDLLAGLPARFPRGVRQIVTRAFASDGHAVLEVRGAGLFKGQRPYRNTYCFIVSVDGGRVTQIREYLDTRHSADVFEGRNLDRRTSVAVPPPLPSPKPTTPAGRAALRMLAAISAADVETFLGLFTPNATWWADGGRDRRWSDPGAPVNLDPEQLVVGRVPVTLRGRRIGELAAAFEGGLSIVGHHLVEDAHRGSGLAMVEASGDGLRLSTGRHYQNRYAFVIRVDPAGLIHEVREYCDTLHAFDVYDFPL